jgi:hypothetical protein
MEETNVPILDVSHDSSIEFRLSDITPSPDASPKTERTARMKSIDAKLKRRWQQKIQRERAYEKEKVAKAEQLNDSSSSSFIDVSFGVR